MVGLQLPLKLAATPALLSMKVYGCAIRSTVWIIHRKPAFGLMVSCWRWEFVSMLYAVNVETYISCSDELVAAGDAHGSKEPKLL